MKGTFELFLKRQSEMRWSSVATWPMILRRATDSSPWSSRNVPGLTGRYWSSRKGLTCVTSSDEPRWQEQKQDLKCPVCGFRYWTYFSIKAGKRCPVRVVRDGKTVQCEGKLVKSR